MESATGAWFPAHHIKTLATLQIAKFDIINKRERIERVKRRQAVLNKDQVVFWFFTKKGKGFTFEQTEEYMNKDDRWYIYDYWGRQRSFCEGIIRLADGVQKETYDKLIYVTNDDYNTLLPHWVK